MRELLKLTIKSVILCVFCFFAFNAFADTLSGKVIDIFGENIATIQFAQNPGLQVGDNIDLTYMAGVLPMVIGVYEVATVNNNVIISKPLSITMPPSKGMNVQVDVVKKQPSAPAPQQEQNFDEMGHGREWTTLNFDNVERSDDSQPQLIEIKGEVLDVMGDDVKVAIKDNGAPQVGWQVDLFYVTAQGGELPVGTWRVKSVEGQALIASKVKGVGNAVKGLKAVIHNGQKQKVKIVENNVSPGPGGAGSVGDLFSDTGPGIFKDVQPNQPPPKDMFGEDNLFDQNRLNQYIGTNPFDSSKGAQRIKGNPDQWSNLTFDEYKKKLESMQGSNQELIAMQIDAFKVKRRYWLGVEVATNDTTLGQAFASEPMGVRVTKIFPSSPAARKLEIADIILEANGIKITAANQFSGLVANSENGRLNLKIHRNYKIIEKTINLKKMK